MNLDLDEQKEWYKIRTGQSSEHLGDCLELMPLIADESIDMILCDLPYGTTACKWDSILPLDKLWEQYERIIKPNGSIVLTASQPFTSILTCSNLKLFKYEWIWKKTRPSGSMLCNKQPLKEHESVLVFYKKKGIYNPQMAETKRIIEKKRTVNKGEVVNSQKLTRQFDNKGLAYPRTIFEFSNPNHNSLHPTQKPVGLFNYLIKTYTNENDIVLDNTAGAFTTAIACLETNRKYIVMEKEKEYYNKGIKRILEWKQSKGSRLF
jgi:site-specific DNA-methyltransferase (adenine-specific)